MKTWLIVIVMALLAAVAWKELGKRGIAPSMHLGGEMHLSLIHILTLPTILLV